jgi:NAD-dependent histone deacetylase SIR2
MIAQANNSAVPDFRSATGLFNSLKAEHGLKGSGKDLFDASVYRDANSTSTFHTMVSQMSRMTKDAKPTTFHHMLATLAHEGRLLRLYSQNVDGIDTGLEPLKTRIPLTKDASGKWPKTVQVHGGLDKMVCNKCSTLSDFDADLFDGPIAPICGNCETVNDIRTNIEGKRSHGIGRLRPRMVLYNEHNPDDEAIGKVASDDLRRRPDAVIVVGTTLKIPGVQRIVREMCGVVRNRKDGMAIWINNDPPPSGPQYSDCWDIIVRGKADAVANHAAMRRWDDPINAAELDNISDEEVINRAKEKTASVVLPRSELPSHLERSPLPEGHINNSFRPPTESPTTPRRQRAPVDSPDFSPLTSRRPSVVPTIEQVTDGDNIVVAESGLLTPSKSQKSSTPTLASVFDTLQSKTKGKGKSQKGATKQTKAAPKSKAAPKKATTGKVGRPAKSKAAKTAPIIPSASLKSSFSSSKGSVTVAEGKKLNSEVKKLPGDLPTKFPSKLREVSNHSPDSAHTTSPSDARKDLSPTATRGTLPWLKKDSDNKTAKRTMDLASVMN